MRYPQLSNPGICPQFAEDQATQYDRFLEYILYTAEQVIEADPSWETTFEGLLKGHMGHFCASSGWDAYTDPVNQIIARLRSANCEMVPACAD